MFKIKQDNNFFYFTILLILSGPPILRDAVNQQFFSYQESRDIWLYFKIFSYIFIFIITLNYFLLNFKESIRFLKIDFLFFLIFFFFSLFASYFSINPIYSILYLFLFITGFIFAISLSHKILRLNIQLNEILKFMLNVYLFLSLLTLILVYFYPERVGLLYISYDEIRITGGKFINFKFIGFILFTISLHFYFNTKFKKKYFLIFLYSLLIIYLSKTRSLYIICFFTFFYYFFKFRIHTSQIKKNFFLIFLITGLLILYILIFKQDLLFNVFTRNNTTDLFSFSGRPIIWKIGFDILYNEYFGIGLGNTQAYLLNLGQIEYKGSYINFSNIGTFHNAYLEIIICCGVIGGSAFLLLIFNNYYWIFMNYKFLNSNYSYNESLTIMLLFTGALSFGFTETYIFQPTYDTYGFLFFILSLIFSMKKLKFKLI